MESRLLILAAFAVLAAAGDASGQWNAHYLTLHRGAIAHSITNKGMSGRRDNAKKQAPSGFSYPQGRSLSVKTASGYDQVNPPSCESVL